MKKQSKKLKLINMFVKKYGYRSYLEIGSRKRKTFRGVRVKDKCGVDPNWPCTHRMTSDAFFAQNERTFDIILVEGCRIGEQPYKDIVNALGVLNPRGTIIVRGANQPKRWFYDTTLKIPRTKERVWLAVTKIHRERSDLTIRTVADECGLTIIRRGEGDGYSYSGEITRDYFLANRKKAINLVSWGWAKRKINGNDINISH